MDQQGFKHLVSGCRKGPVAWGLRLVLSPAGGVYSLVVRIRNFLYDKGLLKSQRAGAPVVSVGNLTVGGTGKTPLVIWLAGLLGSKGLSCGILTRGYKMGSAGTPAIDEPAILARECLRARVIVNADRIAGAAEAVKLHSVEVLLLDDGFQHRRLARDLDIVAIDATCPFGYGRVLPAGLLREPVSGLKRAHAAVITRSDQVHKDDLAAIEDELRRRNPRLVIARTRHLPVSATDDCGHDLELGRFSGKRVFAFSGIGNPEGFFATVRGLGCEIVATLAFDDHHHYSHNDLAYICGEALKSGAEWILTTQKDWISSPLGGFKASGSDGPTRQYALPFAFLSVRMEFTDGRDAFTSLIEQALGDTMSDRKQP